MKRMRNADCGLRIAALLLVTCHLSLVTLFVGCRSNESVMTVAPAPIKPKVVSDWARRNIVDYDESGVWVTADYVRVYKDLLHDFGTKLAVSSRPESADDGIAPGSHNGRALFHITFEVRDRFDDLKYFERNGYP